jgi:hypothetical protein
MALSRRATDDQSLRMMLWTAPYPHVSAMGVGAVKGSHSRAVHSIRSRHGDFNFGCLLLPEGDNPRGPHFEDWPSTRPVSVQPLSRIRFVIASGCDMRERWLAFTSILFAPMGLPMKGSRSGLMIRVFGRYGIP